MKLIPAVTYDRYSSDNQKAESITAQLRYNHEYAKKHGYEIIKDYIDEAQTGKSDNRDQFQQMLTDAKSGLFQVVICHKVDRFARNRTESAIHKYNLKKQNVKVVFSGQAIDDSPEGQLMEGILESMAEYYSLNLAKETMKGLRENAFQCKFNGGYVAFGYSIEPVTKTYVINEQEAFYVKYIFEAYLKEKKYREIIEDLNKWGVKSRFGREFTESSLHDLLQNEKYMGVYTFNKRTPRAMDGKRTGAFKEDDEIIRVPGGVPAIIDEEAFIMVQEKLKKKRRTTKAKEPYLLSGLVFCGECNKPMCGNRKHNGYGKIYAYYRCNGRCGNKEIDKEFLEQLVYDKLTNNIFSKKALSSLSKKLNAYMNSKRSAEKERVESLKSRIDSIAFEQNNIVNAIAQGYNQPIFQKKLSDLDEELKQIRYEYELLRIKLETQGLTANEIDIRLKEQREYIISKNALEVKQFISNYVESVIIYKDAMEFNLMFDDIPI